MHWDGNNYTSVDNRGEIYGTVEYRDIDSMYYACITYPILISHAFDTRDLAMKWVENTIAPITLDRVK